MTTPQSGDKDQGTTAAAAPPLPSDAIPDPRHSLPADRGRERATAHAPGTGQVIPDQRRDAAGRKPPGPRPDTGKPRSGADKEEEPPGYRLIRGILADEDGMRRGFLIVAWNLAAIVLVLLAAVYIIEAHAPMLAKVVISTVACTATPVGTIIASRRRARRREGREPDVTRAGAGSGAPGG